MQRDIEAIIAELKAALIEQVEVRETGPGRVISRSARTVMPGMMVEFSGYGWRECVGVTIMGDKVLLSDGGQAFWTPGAKERVRTRRPDAA